MVKAKPNYLIQFLLAVMAISILCLDSGCKNSEMEEYERLVEKLNAVGSQFDGNIKLEHEYFDNLFWQADGRKLHFTTVASKSSEKITILRSFDRETLMINEISFDRRRLVEFAVNECGDLVAMASGLGLTDNGISIIDSAGRARFVEPGKMTHPISPTWLSNCTDIAIVGIHNGEYGLYLYDVDSGDFRLVRSSKSDSSTSISYRSKKFPQDAARGGIVFDYNLNDLSKSGLQMTYNFGVLDVKSGKVQKTISHGKFPAVRVDKLNWRYSAIEDTIYYFTLDESYHLDSLWRIDSSGENLTKVLDGQEIGNPYWWHTFVSWSDDGKQFAFVIEGEKRYGPSKGIYLVDTSKKEITRLVPDVRVCDFNLFAMSPDGKQIAYVSDQNAVYILDIETKVSEEIYSIGQGPP
jgi:translation elongation factor P/translation initiation factor 5A